MEIKSVCDLVGDDPIHALQELVAVVEMDGDYNTPKGIANSDAFAALFTAQAATGKLVKRGKTATLVELLLEQPDFNVPQRVRDTLQTFAYKD